VGALLFGAALMVMGQDRSPAPSSPPAPTSLSRARLEEAIRSRFAASKIAVNGFTVRVQGSTAILEGTTGVVQHKSTATRLARLAGAREVDNRIAVTEQARQAAARKRRGEPRRVRVQWRDKR
jgi:hypothetical protein